MSSRRWFSRVGRRGGGRQTDAEPLTAEVRNVRNARNARRRGDLHHDGRPTNAALLGGGGDGSGSGGGGGGSSQPLPLSPTNNDESAAVFVEEEVAREEDFPTTQPPSLIGSTEQDETTTTDRGQYDNRYTNNNTSTSTNNNSATRDVLAAVEDHGLDQSAPPPSPPTRRLLRPSSSFGESGQPARESSHLHDMASAKMAAYSSRAAAATAGFGGGSFNSNPDAVMIPIAPGVSARLRGANETFDCIERDFYIPATCFACSLEMCCIQDADYVICPVCRVVSPLDNGMHAASPYLSNDFRGQREQTVGLGFTFEDLCKWQTEIVARRSGTTV